MMTRRARGERSSAPARAKLGRWGFVSDGGDGTLTGAAIPPEKPPGGGAENKGAVNVGAGKTGAGGGRSARAGAYGAGEYAGDAAAAGGENAAGGDAKAGAGGEAGGERGATSGAPSAAPQNRQNCASASHAPRQRVHTRISGTAGVAVGDTDTTRAGEI